MPRGYNPKFKPAKAVQADPTTPVRAPSVPSMLRKATFLSRNTIEKKPTVTVTVLPDEPAPVQEASPQQFDAADARSIKADFVLDSQRSVPVPTDAECAGVYDATSNGLPDELEQPTQPMSDRALSAEPTGDEVPYEAVVDTLEELTVEETQSSASSLYSRTSSIYTKDSASIYSSASSIYSSGASVYSFDENEEYTARGSTELIAEESEVSLESRLPGGLQYQQRQRSVAARRREPQDAASRERSTLVKKAALFKNSRLPSQLPSFGASLPTWSMVCRAAQASQDCYDSYSRTRLGTYTPAKSSKDIKAMIVDDQLIDNSRLVIVSIRGTQFKCLTDWTVNKNADPVKPAGFLDDEENACHEGFLQVAKAMVAQVAAQLQQHPASAEQPSLVFTGHSAGGAVAAMLYSHMLSTSVSSDLTALAGLFSSINCVTFGAPPLSLTPLPRRDHIPGSFLSFTNEGDPVTRLSNAAYVKSLAKLMTASPPSSVTSAIAPPQVKVVRRSRGTGVIRQTVSEKPATPWEELPMWPTPPAPLTNAGDVILLRDRENGRAAASRVTMDDLKDVIFADLAQHATEAYMRRITEVALAAMMGRDAS